jgi:4-aminobutyrate aminotransferase / (S)-3-amino-2-methylpropionate transaminase / 5-aminovalerate transaminase
MHPWALGGTYGANPVAAAVALAVLEIFEEEDMLGKAKALGKKLHDHFEDITRKYPVVGSIRGIGAMLGLELVKGERREPAADEAKKLAVFCLEIGLIILVCGTYSNVIRVLVPFVITDPEIEKALDILDRGLATLSSC